MARVVYFQVLDFVEAMIGKDLLLGISSTDGSPNILVTGEQREAMRLGNLRRKDASAYLALSLVQYSDPSEMNEMIRGPRTNNSKQKKRWWIELADSKREWAMFEHSRALFSMFRGIDSKIFDADSKWSNARLFAFSANNSKLPGLTSIIVDLSYSEFATKFSLPTPNRLRTIRYILRRNLSVAPNTGDMAAEQLHISEQELPNKMQEFLSQGSADYPFVLLVYGFEAAKKILGKCPGVVLEDGIETLLYPSRSYVPGEMQRRDPRLRSASPRRRDSSPDRGGRSRSPTRVHIIDVNKMIRSVSKIHEDYPSLRKDADRLGVKRDSNPMANAAFDTRVIMELWCLIASGSNMRAQKEGRGVSTTIGSSSNVTSEDNFVSEDPNDLDYVVEPPPQNTSASGNEPAPYEFSDSDNDDENF